MLVPRIPQAGSLSEPQTSKVVTEARAELSQTCLPGYASRKTSALAGAGTTTLPLPLQRSFLSGQLASGFFNELQLIYRDHSALQTMFTWCGSHLFPKKWPGFSFYWWGNRDSEGEGPQAGTWSQTFQGQHYFHYPHTSFEWLCYHDCLNHHHLLNTYYMLSLYCHIHSITTWCPIDISKVTCPREETWFCIPTPAPPSVFLILGNGTTIHPLTQIPMLGVFLEWGRERRERERKSRGGRGGEWKGARIEGEGNGEEWGRKEWMEEEGGRRMEEKGSEGGTKKGSFHYRKA